jgi:hypothetical protein
MMNFILLSCAVSWLLIVGCLMFGGREIAIVNQTGNASAAAGQVDDSRLLRRLRNPRLLTTYLLWRAAQTGTKPPRLAKFCWKDQPESPNAFTVAVENAGEGEYNFRYLQVGAALEARLGHKIVGRAASELDPGESSELFGSLEGAYRHCARTLAPSYEYANYDFGDDAPLTFERLILPFLDAKGRIRHLVGIVLFDDQGTRYDGIEYS